MSKKIAFAAILLAATSAAFAAEPKTIYAGADIGATRISDWDDKEFSYGAFVGYNLTRNIAVEAGYRRLGEEKGGGIKVHGDQAMLSAIGSMPVGESFSVFGRVGVSNLESKVRGGGLSFSDSTTKAVLGVGASYAFNPKVSGRVEFQRTGSDVSNLSAGVAYQF